MGQFRKTILAAAHDADLTFGERVKLRIVMRLRPRALEQAILDEAIVEGVVPEGLTLSNIDSPSAPMAIDWDALANFIVKILPAIMQIIQLFMVPNPGAMIAFILCAALASTVIAQCPNCGRPQATAIQVLPAPNYSYTTYEAVQSPAVSYGSAGSAAYGSVGSAVKSYGSSGSAYGYATPRSSTGSWLAQHLSRDHGVNTAGMSESQMVATHNAIHASEGMRSRSGWRLFGRWR